MGRTSENPQNAKFVEFLFRDCPKRGTSNPRSVDLDGGGCQNGPKSTVSVVHKATPQALPTLFGQSRKSNSRKFGVAISPAWPRP